MYNVRQVCEDTWMCGASDRRIQLFENVYPVPDGVSYNDYVILDQKTCLLDGVDSSVRDQFLENLEHVLDGRPLDYMVVHHMEPDHAAVLADLVLRYPDLTVVASAQAFKMMGQFFDFDLADRKLVVKEGSTLELGKHTLAFVAAPMVHWPEVLVSFDTTTGALFSADAFGSFGALGGNVWADEVEWDRDYAAEARRYYVNIVGKYGLQTTNLLKKAGKLDIKYLFPLHGYLWRRDLGKFIDLCAKWASYTPEVDSVCVFYGSIYGHTANAASILAAKLADRGLRNVRVFDVSKTDCSELVSRAFEYSTLVFASSTYNMGIFDRMDSFVDDLAKHNLQKRTVGIIQNGTWAPQSGALLKERLGALRDVTVLDPMVQMVSAVKPQTLDQLDALADALAASIQK